MAHGISRPIVKSKYGQSNCCRREKLVEKAHSKMLPELGNRKEAGNIGNDCQNLFSESLIQHDIFQNVGSTNTEATDGQMSAAGVHIQP